MDMQATLSLLQISDSAFPIGGFSHSLGLEALVQHEGRQRISTDKRRLIQTFVCILENAGSFGIPFVKAGHCANGETDKLCNIDKYCEATSANHIVKRASTKQGKSLVDTAIFIYSNLDDETKGALDSLPYQHFPVVFGAVTFALGLDCDLSIMAFMFSVVRTLIATAVRLDVIGIMEGQKIQVYLQQLVPELISRNVDRDLDSAAIRFPFVDILQNTHDTLFCKLFYS